MNNIYTPLIAVSVPFLDDVMRCDVMRCDMMWHLRIICTLPLIKIYPCQCMNNLYTPSHCYYCCCCYCHCCTAVVTTITITITTALLIGVLLTLTLSLLLLLYHLFLLLSLPLPLPLPSVIDWCVEFIAGDRGRRVNGSSHATSQGKSRWPPWSSLW